VLGHLERYIEISIDQHPVVLKVEVQRFLHVDLTELLVVLQVCQVRIGVLNGSKQALS
jgi:hypothetical protein